MTRLAWYKRDPAAFLDGTMTMTLEETGAYAKVLELIYVRDGACPDSERWIAGHLNCEVRTWRRLRARLIELGKLYVDGDTLRNPRADSTIASGLDRLNQTISAGKRSGEERRKSGHKSGNFNGSGGTPVQADVPTSVGETKTKSKKEKKETLPAAAESSHPRARAHEAAAAIPAASRIPYEVDFLERVEAAGGDPFAAGQVLAAWKAEFAGDGYAAVLRATLASARSNPLALAELKFGDLRKDRRRGDAEARQQQTSEWSADALIAAAARRQVAEAQDDRDAWPVVAECPRLGGPE